MVASVVDGSSSYLQLPLFGLFIYGWLIFLVNRTKSEITPAGAVVRNGPIWSGSISEHRIAREHVVSLFVREEHAAKHGMSYYTTVQLTSGQWVDLAGPSDSPDDPIADARQIARLWSRPDEIRVYATFPPKINRKRTVVIMLGWLGAFVAALLWAAFVDLRRLGY